MKKSLVLPDGTITHLCVNPRASLRTLKAQLQLQVGIPIPMQSLSASGKELNEKDLVIACDAEIALSIRLPSFFPLRLTILRTYNTGVKISVLGSDLISKVKTRIGETLGIDRADLRLFVDEKLTTDNQIVTEVYRHGGVWKVLQQDEFFVTVVCSNGQSFKAAASPRDKVQTITSRLRDFEAFECGDQIICCQGKELNKTSTLHELQISDSAVLECQATSFWLWVAFLGLRRIKLHLNPSEPILAAVTRSMKEVIPWAVINGTVLTAQTTPLDLGQPSGAIIECGDLLVRVRSWNVERLELAVLANSFVASLRQVLRQRLGHRYFKLMHKGYELPDDKTFKDFGFEGETTIEIVTQSDESIWVKTDKEMVAISIPQRVSLVEYLYHSITGDTEGFDFFRYNGGIISQFDDDTLRSWGLKDFLRGREIDEIDLKGGEMLTFYRRKEEDINLHNSQQISEHFFENCSKQRLVLRNAQRLPFSLPYTEFTLVSEVKEMVQRLMDEECAVLAWKDTCLENEKYVSDYQIEGGEFVDICRKNELVVRLFDRYGPLYITFSQDNAKLEEIRRQVEEHVREGMNLFYHALLLDDQVSLAELNITTGSTLVAIPTSSYNSAHTLQSPLPPSKFVAIQRINGDIHIIYFHESNTLQDLKTFLQEFLDTSVFFLVLCNRLMTTQQFSQIKTGSIVQVFTPKEALLMRYCAGTVEPVLLSPGATVRSAIGKQATRLEIYCGAKKVNLDGLVEDECKSGVVECVCKKEFIFTARWADMEPMLLIMNSPTATISDLITKVQTLECDSSLRPRVFINKRLRDSDFVVYPNCSITMLEPPLVYIRVLMPQWREFIMHLKNSETVGLLRTKIAKELRLREEHVRLLYENKLLIDDSLTLENVGIEIEASITALRPEDLLVFVSSKCAFVYNVDSTTLVSRVESRVYSCFGLNKREVHLLLNGVLLKRKVCFKSYTNANAATLEFFKSSETLLFIRSINGQQAHKVVATESISLPLLHSLQSRPEPAPRSLHWTGEVNSILTLRDYGVPTSLFLIKRSATGSKITLFVVYHRNKFWRIKIERTASVDTLKRNLPGGLGYSKTLFLIHGVAADLNKPLYEYNVFDGEFIEVILGEKDIVRVIYGQQILYFDVLATTTVGEVKTQISNRLFAPASMQLLYCKGQLLTDSSLVRELNADIELCSTFACIHSWSRVVAVSTDKISTVLDVKKTLAPVTKIAAEKQRLYLSGLELSDNQPVPLSDIGGENMLTVLAPGEVLICVKSVFVTCHICAKETDTFQMIAKKVQRVLGIHYSRFQLIAEAEVNSDRIAKAVCSLRMALLTDFSDRTSY